MDRNFILAIALSMAVLLGWDMLIEAPQREAREAARQAAIEAAEQNPSGLSELDENGLGALEGAAEVTIEDALKTDVGRVRIETETLTGSLNLAGARIDDLSLKQYRETIDPSSPIIRLLSPSAAAESQYMQQGWYVNGQPNEETPWQQVGSGILTPTTPVTLQREKDGVQFEMKISIDDAYMFTIDQKVNNQSAAAQNLAAYALVRQKDTPTNLKNFMILHEGPVGMFGKSLYQRKYKKMLKVKSVKEGGDRGWVGITSKNWLAAAIPTQGTEFKAEYLVAGSEQTPVFYSTYTMDAVALEPGSETTMTSYLFGGPKDVDLLQSYEASPENGGLGVYSFDKAIDWGNFFFLTRPIFYVLNFFGDLVGNFGVAILLLTLVIKAILFPLASKAYVSMAQMKKLQPEIEKLRKRYSGDDEKMKLQQEMMALYKKEKMNPLAGCWPILIQMPIFYALYKTLFVTIELRHAPFALWIKDLSAPDPTSIFNLFGLIPYDPTAIPMIGAFLGIGVLPLLMGVAMWFQTKLNPPPADPMQAQIFAMMPIVFTFLFASFASGLVLYWFWNTALSILQQWTIMKRNGAEVDWGERFSFLKKDKPAAGSDGD